MPDHKQTPVYNQDGEVVFEADEGIINLIQYLFDRGVRTYNSCQDNAGGAVWVSYSLDSWKGICAQAFHSQDHELTYFIQEYCNIELQFHDDGFPDENDEYWIEGQELIWTASVRFHKDLLDDFEELLKSLLGPVRSRSQQEVH